MSLGLLLNRGSDHFSILMFAHDAVPQFVGDVLAIIDNWGLYQPMLRIQYRLTFISDRESANCNDQCEKRYGRFVLRASAESRKNGLRWQAYIPELFDLILKLLCRSLHPLLLLCVFFIHLSLYLLIYAITSISPICHRCSPSIYHQFRSRLGKCKKREESLYTSCPWYWVLSLTSNLAAYPFRPSTRLSNGGQDHTQKKNENWQKLRCGCSLNSPLWIRLPLIWIYNIPSRNKPTNGRHGHPSGTN